MNRVLRRAAGLVLVFSAPVTAKAQTASAPGADSASVSYAAVYDALTRLTPREDRVARVENMVLRRDVLDLTLRSGQLILLSPVRERTVGAVFLGEGELSLTPPTEVERRQLNRFFETDTLTKPFSKLFLLFADTTVDELERRLTFGSTAATDGAEDLVTYALKYLNDEDSQSFHPSILGALLNDAEHELFYAHIGLTDGDPVFFLIDPYDVEEVSLSRRIEDEHASEVICQFHRQADYQSALDLTEERKDRFQVVHYTLESTIAKNLDYRGRAEMQLEALVTGDRWLPLVLFSTLEIDSASWGDGTPAQVVRGEKTPILWVYLETPFTAGERRMLTLSYHGEIMSRQGDWFFVRSTYSWFPRHGFAPATYDLTFHTPSRFLFASIGTRVAAEERDDVRTTRWEVSRPTAHVSFNIGNFEEHDVDFPGLPKTTVYMADEAHRDLPTRFLSGAGMMKKVAADVANSLTFYQEVFGPPITDHFYATEIPYGHGQAFPGLIHLSWATFHADDEEEGTDQVFRAHEMAHQWWGIGVDTKTYHDRWLGEGMSEFAALWFLDDMLNKRDQMEELLKEWREEIADREDEAAPIWLGPRTSTSTTRKDYQLMVYKKGAWVVHMLREIMRDPATMSDEQFKIMMRDFYDRYRGKRVSTRDFQHVVEEHLGMGMEWFFDQWVHGTEIPTYRFAHTTEQTADGRYVLHFRIAQEDVPEDFQMIVPLLVEYGEEATARYQLLVKGPSVQAELPPEQWKPTRVVLNPGEAVLAEVKSEGW